MATADEILAGMAEEGTADSGVLVIDNDLRTITIPESVKILGVESDDDVLRLRFTMPKTYGEFDLSAFEVRINYLNAKNEGGRYYVADAVTGDDEITFSWLVDRHAVQYKGNVNFIVCLKLWENGTGIKEFNTTRAVLPVLEGLETGDAIVQQHPDVIDSILLRLSELEKGGTGGIGIESINITEV